MSPGSSMGLLNEFRGWLMLPSYRRTVYSSPARWDCHEIEPINYQPWPQGSAA
jgi:hypothetical protein